MARKAVERNISYDDVRQLYYVSMELGRDENGKRIKQYRTFPTLTAARNGLRDFHTQRERQAREPQDEVREEMDLAHWLEYWMESIVRPNRAETTVYAYQKIIDNHILPALGGIPMSRLSAKRIQRYYTDTQQAAGLSSNTMRRHHDLLSSALRSAVRQDMLLASPMDRVEPPRSRVKEAFFYDNEELKQLYQLIEGHILELAVKMAGSLGMRREEICGLKWENVDFRRRLALVRALALGGQLYLLDEPFTGVDPARVRRLMDALRALDAPVLLSSHETLACSLADQVICLDGPPLRLAKGQV